MARRSYRGAKVRKCLSLLKHRSMQFAGAKSLAIVSDEDFRLRFKGMTASAPTSATVWRRALKSSSLSARTALGLKPSSWAWPGSRRAGLR